MMDICPRCSLEIESPQPFCPQCKLDLFYGQFKQAKFGYCIFCQRKKGLTEEHIIPKWMSGCITEGSTATLHELARPVEIGLPLSPIVTGKGLAHKKEPPSEAIKIRNVCNDCNNGWMSRLQNAAKPLILEIIANPRFQLDEMQRNILARWFAVTTVNLECLNNIIIIPARDKLDLMNGKMPPGWEICVARRHVGEEGYYSKHRALSVLFVEDKKSNIQTTTFCFGGIIFHSLSTAIGERFLSLVKLATLQFVDYDIKHGMHMIWPTKHVFLAPSRGTIGRGDVEALQDYLAGRD